MAAMIPVVIAVLITGSPAAVAEDCSRSERWLAGSLETARFAKDPEGAVQSIFEATTSALQRPLLRAEQVVARAEEALRARDGRVRR